MRPELVEALERLWGSEPPRPCPNGEATAEALERRYGVTLPDDFRAYLTQAAPAERWDAVTGHSLWTPKEILSVSDERATWGSPRPAEVTTVADAGRYLLFADWVDWCGYAYAICCADGPDRGKVALIGTDWFDHLVASDLCGFLGLVAEDSMHLHSAGGKHHTDIV